MAHRRHCGGCRNWANAAAAHFASVKARSRWLMRLASLRNPAMQEIVPLLGVMNATFEGGSYCPPQRVWSSLACFSIQKRSCERGKLLRV